MVKSVAGLLVLLCLRQLCQLSHVHVLLVECQANPACQTAQTHAYLLSHKCPDLVQVNDGVEVLVAAQVEVTHTDLQGGVKCCKARSDMCDVPDTFVHHSRVSAKGGVREVEVQTSRNTSRLKRIQTMLGQGHSPLHLV